MGMLTIQVTADVVCPWCWLGWRRLKRALALKPDVKADITWRAFQLNPGMPPEGADYNEYMAKKFEPARMQKAQALLRELGEEEGIAFHFEKIKKAPNTNAAHRLIRWAQQEGHLDAVAEGVMRAYFAEGRFIGDEKELADIGAAAGMDRALVLQRFAEGVDIDAIRADHAAARDSGVSGVPFYLIGGKIRVEGSHPAADLAEEIVASVK
jgi:predicted DsbA family dithiol-disulfide isomerase